MEETERRRPDRVIGRKWTGRKSVHKKARPWNRADLLVALLVWSSLDWDKVRRTSPMDRAVVKFFSFHDEISVGRGRGWIYPCRFKDPTPDIPPLLRPWRVPWYRTRSHPLSVEGPRSFTRPHGSLPRTNLPKLLPIPLVPGPFPPEA